MRPPMLLPIRMTGLSRLALDQRRAMGCDQLRQRVRPSPSLPHVVVIERFNITERRKALLPALHPGMR